MTQQEVDFSVFLLRRLAQSWGRPVPEAYEILTATGILDDYVIPCYDTLHTLGTEHLVEDITEFVRERGVTV
jgi:hypothetical protein